MCPSLAPGPLLHVQTAHAWTTRSPNLGLTATVLGACDVETLVTILPDVVYAVVARCACIADESFLSPPSICA